MARRIVPWLVVALMLAGCSSGATPGPSSLPAGTYTSKVFKPAVTYTLPSGWDNPNDTADYLDLTPAGSDVGGIFLFRDPQVASQDSLCPATPAAGIIANK